MLGAGEKDFTVRLTGDQDPVHLSSRGHLTTLQPSAYLRIMASLLLLNYKSERSQPASFLFILDCPTKFIYKTKRQLTVSFEFHGGLSCECREPKMGLPGEQ